MATQISALNVKNHALQFLDYGKLIQGGYHANFCMKTQKLKLVKKPMIIKNER